MCFSQEQQANFPAFSIHYQFCAEREAKEL